MLALRIRSSGGMGHVGRQRNSQGLSWDLRRTSTGLTRSN